MEHLNTFLKVPDFETAYAELQRIQEERLKAAVLEAEEKTRTNLMCAIEEMRQKAALEMSLQRNSYEDEIALLNRVIEKHCNMKEESDLPDISFHNNGALQEVECMLQEVKKTLEHSSENSLVKFECWASLTFRLTIEFPQNLAAVQDLIDEANVICQHLQAPYTFLVMQRSLDKSMPMIRVKNVQSNKVAHLTIDELYASMSVLKEALANSRSFPVHVFDGKEFVAAEDELLCPKIKEKLLSLQKPLLNGSLNDSFLSVESPKCLSFPTDHLRAHKTRKASVSEIVACKDLICSIVPGDVSATFSSVISSFVRTLSNPITSSPEILVTLVTQSSTLLSTFPLVIQHFLKSSEIVHKLQREWVDSSNQLTKDFQQSLISVLQVAKSWSSISFVTNGLLN